MKIITLEENSEFREVRESGGRWYWSMSAPYGNLSETVRIRSEHPPYEGDRLIFVRASDGETFEPVEKKQDEALGEPFWYGNRIYIPCMNFREDLIEIRKWKPGSMYTSTKALFSSEEIEGSRNLRLYGRPLTLAAEAEDRLQILWPENISVKKDANETFCIREGSDLFFSAGGEDANGISKTIKRNIYTGDIEAVLPGSVRRQRNGDLWLLSSAVKARQSSKPSLKVLIWTAVCMFALVVCGAAGIALHHGNAVLPVWFTAAVLSAAAGVLCGKLIPLKTQLRLAMPLYFILVLILGFFHFNHISQPEPLNVLGIDAFPAGLIPLFYIGGAYYISKYSSFSMDHLLIPGVLLFFIPESLAVFMFESLGWVITLMIAFLLYASLLGRMERFNTTVKRVMTIGFVVLVLYFVLAPVWLPLLYESTAYAERFGDNPWIQDYIATFRNARLFGESSLILHGVSASEYFAVGTLATLPLALLVKYGWIPFAGLLGASGILLILLLSVARKAGNSFGRNLVTGIYSLFTVRILVNAISVYLFEPLYCALPYGGDLFSMMTDVFVSVFALMVCTKSDDTVTEILDQERETVTMMDALIDVVMDQIGLKNTEFDEAEEWDDDTEFEAAGRKWKLKELLADREALAEEQITQEVILQKYGDAMVEKIAPGSWERSRIFISYNHLDSRIAKYLANAMEEAGETAWYYERDIRYGSYPEQIMKALRQSKIFVVILSGNSNNSEEVKNEVFNAQKMVADGIVLLPLVIEDIELSDFMQHYLGRYEQSFAQKRPIEPELDQFVQKTLAICNDLADDKETG